MMYSQNNEEEVIVNYFKETEAALFIDIGAYNPFKFSNTRKLYEQGWGGIYVEPDPICFSSFVNEYGTNTKIKLCNFGLSSETKDLPFYQSGGDAVSTFITSHKNKWEKGGTKYSKIIVKVISVEEFFKEYFNDSVRFISLDTEAQNIEIFNCIPQYVFNQISLFCIEHDNQHDYISTKLKSYGFSPLCLNGENIILGK